MTVINERKIAMKLHSNLHLSKKIAQLRKLKGMSQASLAEAVDRSIMHISRIERGEAACDDEMLMAIKKAMGVEDAPLTEHELEEYIGRLWVFSDLVHVNNVYEAKKIQGTLSPILELPFERNLTLLYIMIETRILFKEGNLAAGKERLTTAETLLDAASPEALHFYHRNMGFVLMQTGEYKTALKHFLKCLDYKTDNIKPDANIELNIGLAYINFGKPWQALIYFEQAKIKCDVGMENTLESRINGALAIGYMHVGEYSNAEQRHNNALVQAKRTNNSGDIGMTLANISVMYLIKGDYKKALDTCVQAMELLKDHPMELLKEHPIYKTLFANQAIILMQMKEFAKSRDILEQCKALVHDDESYAILLEAISHLMTIDKGESSDYLVNIAIPHFRARNEMTNAGIYQALALCDLVEAYYRKNRKIKKANEIAVIGRDIHKEIFFGELDLD